MPNIQTCSVLFCDLSLPSTGSTVAPSSFAQKEKIAESLLPSLRTDAEISLESEFCVAGNVLNRIRTIQEASRRVAVVCFASEGSSLESISMAVEQIGEGSVFVVTNSSKTSGNEFGAYRQYKIPEGNDSTLVAAYWHTLNDLALDISHCLHRSRHDLAGPSIFIAPVSESLESLANKLRRDLESRGFGVRSASEEIEAVLAKSALSVHLFANGAENTASGDRSIGPFRSALGYARAHPEFQVLGWTDSSDTTDASGLNEWILRDATDFSQTGEIMHCAIEDFKSALYDRLRLARDSSSTERTAKSPIPAEASGRKAVAIYVMYDPRDSEAVVPVTNFLEHEGAAVLLPEFHVDQMKLRAMHNENLRRCDAALIIYGSVQEQWVRMKQQDLLRASALGRKKNLTAKGVFLCSTKTEGKLRFNAADMMIIKGFDSAAELAPFVQRLNAH